MKHPVLDAQVSPEGRLEVLSAAEVSKLLDASQGGLYQTFRNCALAVLNCGGRTDDGRELLQRYQTFDISIIQRERGIKLDIRNAPAEAFVDGCVIKGIQEHLFAVLRDIIYASDEVIGNPRFDLATSLGITDAVFHILRNADVAASADALLGMGYGRTLHRPLHGTRPTAGANVQAAQAKIGRAHV